MENNRLLQILSDYLCERPSNNSIAPEDISLARSHQLIPIVYYQTKDAQLCRSYLQAIDAYTKRNVILAQITEAFSNIQFFTVKGMAVSRFYPVPQLRTMGDCDIIVNEDDRELAKQILLSLGFCYIEDKRDGAEWHFKKQNLTFELHNRLLYDEVVNTPREVAFADTAWKYVQNHILDVNFHFVFVLIHLKKHLLKRGVGFRQFMDLAAMSKNANLDSEVIREFLQQVNLEKFAGVCSALCSRWFGIYLPVKTFEISDEFYNNATDTILTNGVFGFENLKSAGNDILNSISRFGKIKSVICKIFPSYEDCAGTIKYKWVKGKPYLMPVLWLGRPFEFLFTGRIHKGFKYILDVADSKKVISERNKELSAWGLTIE